MPHSGAVCRLSSRFFGIAPGFGSSTGPRRHAVYLVEVIVADQDLLLKVIVVTAGCLAAKVGTCSKRLSSCRPAARVVVGWMGFVRMAGTLFT